MCLYIAVALYVHTYMLCFVLLLLLFVLLYCIIGLYYIVLCHAVFVTYLGDSSSEQSPWRAAASVSESAGHGCVHPAQVGHNAEG